MVINHNYGFKLSIEVIELFIMIEVIVVHLLITLKKHSRKTNNFLTRSMLKTLDLLVSNFKSLLIIYLLFL